MSRKRKRVKKSEIVNYQISDIPENKLIEIHAEAYYRALKRIEEEKNNTPQKKEKWYVNVLFVLNFLLFPFKINKHFQLREQVYDSVLQIFVILILKLSGGLMWLVGLIYAILFIFPGFIRGAVLQSLGYLSWDLIIVLFGSLFFWLEKPLVRRGIAIRYMRIQQAFLHW